MLTSRQIEMFKAIMEYGSITEAANALHVSQPAVSKALRLLELELGLQLFTRAANGLSPTVEARALYAEVERTFIGLAYLSRFAQDLCQLRHGRLVISAIPALSTRWLPTVAARFLADYPEVSLSLQAWNSPHTAQLVEQGRIDLGIAQSRAEDSAIIRTPLFRVETVCVVPDGHPLADADVVTPEHLRGQKFISLSPQDVIRVQLEKLLESQGVDVSPHMEAAMGSTLCALVSKGFGIGMVDAESASNQHLPGITIKKFRPLIEMPVYLLKSTRKSASMIEHEFVKYLTM